MAPVSYRIEGPAAAPLLVLCNSLGTTTEMWGPQMRSLTGHFRVLRYDQRGHGNTPTADGPYSIDALAGDVVELLDTLGETRFSLCGLSLGGMVAMWLASHLPERVDRLVLCCTSAHLPPAEQWSARAAAARLSGPAALVDVLLGRWFTDGFAARRADITQLVAGMLAAADAEGYARCCEAIAAMDQTDDLAGIVAPTLVISGADDPVTTPAMAFDLHQHIAGSSLTVLPSAAHLANLEQPERFTAAVVDHLVGPIGERGGRTRRQVLGDDHVDRADARASGFNAAFQDLITRYAWGEIWTRPGLDRRSRSCITIAILVALGRPDELALHVRAALRNGLNTDEIGEVLLQTAVYCGVPAANAAFSVAQHVLEEEAEVQ